MRINKNVKSIKSASDKFAKHHYPVMNKYYFEKAIVQFNPEKDIFSITFLASTSYDDPDDDGSFYQSSETTYAEIPTTDILTIIKFHVGLVLPKEKSRVVGQVAKEVFKSMKNKHAYTYTGWYGHSKDYAQYVIGIDDFIKTVANQVTGVNR